MARREPPSPLPAGWRELGSFEISRRIGRHYRFASHWRMASFLHAVLVAVEAPGLMVLSDCGDAFWTGIVMREPVALVQHAGIRSGSRRMTTAPYVAPLGLGRRDCPNMS